MKHRIVSILVVALFTVCPALAGADESAPLLLASGSVDQAIATLHGRINAEPNDALAHNLLCRAYFTLGEFDRGIGDCEKAVSLAPNNSQYHLWLGRIYGEKADRVGPLSAIGLARRVVHEFETAVHLNPNNLDARADLAEFYVEAPGIVGGGRDKAVQQANSLEALDPARAAWVKGRIAEKRKDYLTAEREYRNALEASRGAASAWLNLGLFYQHRNRLDAMQEALSHVRKAPLDRPDALVDAAEILLRAQRDLPEAVQLLDGYLKSKSKVEQAPVFKVHYLLGTAQEKLGDRQSAAAEYRQALELANEFQPARQALERVNR
ncbi:MAG TPA: tetratricopeptide repeat protein [Terriglobales bacterium]